MDGLGESADAARADSDFVQDAPVLELSVGAFTGSAQLVLTGGRAGEIYNIGGGDERTNLAVTEQVLRLTGADPGVIRRVADRKAHDLRYSIDDTKIREELGYAPRITFDRGLADTVEWYHDHADWWKAIKHR